MLTAWRPTPARLRSHLAAAAGAELTYGDVGASLTARAPEGFAVIDRTTPVGTGEGARERLAAALVGWGLHREAGMVILTSESTAAVGCDVVNGAPLGPVAVLGPCRVVAVVDEPGRSGFAYGTLPGHPLTGEEQFTAELDARGTALLRIRSFSRPAGVARLLPAAARLGQELVNRRYAAAARRLAA